MKSKLFSLVLALAVLLPAAGQVEAQDMAVHFYLLPVQVVVSNGTTYRGPSYLKWRMNPDGLDVQWSCKDYGRINVMICAVNAEPVNHDWLAIQTDVYQFPANLEASPSAAQLSILEMTLEAAYVPAQWLTPADTWRSVLRTITGMFLFMQRLTAITGDTPLDWGVTLNTQFRNLSQVQQDAIREAFISSGRDDSVIRSNWTLRVILKNAAEQWGSKPIYFGFVTL